jgi:predicted Zn-dependent peptidase
MNDAPAEALVSTLANGVRVLCLPMPHLQTACVSVFVRSGSAHEHKAENGISHFVEHMVFKGTAQRDARRINVDAERLGAEVNAHTDKDHTAFHMRGLARDAPAFVRMLGEIVLQPSFPAHELEQERQVLLHECAEDEDDGLSIAFERFDRACFGAHPAAWPVIGTRRQIERLTREQLVAYVQRQYSGANIVVGVAGAVDAEAIQREVEAVFGAVARGAPNTLAPAPYGGDIVAHRQAAELQAHLVMGFAIPPAAAEDAACNLAATLFGEGMSSPLVQRVREQLGLAYHVSCAADVFDVCGQFVIDASTAPGQVMELLSEVMALLVAQARHVDDAELARARNQIMVRRLRTHERPARRLEDAALDLLLLGRVRSLQALRDGTNAVSASDVRAVFERLLASGVSVSLAGALPRAASARAREIVSRGGAC